MFNQRILSVWWSTLFTMLLYSNSLIVQANNSEITPKIVGHMPTLLVPLALTPGSIVLPGATEAVSTLFKVGEKVDGSLISEYLRINYADSDGDNEDGSIIEWLVNGSVVFVGDDFIPEVTYGGEMLSVRITPSSLGGDPKIGRAVVSDSVIIKSTIVDKFIKPLLKTYTLAEAQTFCTTQNARLPTILELQQLYTEATSLIDKSNQLCSRYGFPLSDACNDGKVITDNYWTSDYKASDYYAVNMKSSQVYGGGWGQDRTVACFLN